MVDAGWEDAGSLPLPPSPLVGREAEVRAVCARLLDPAVRLLTLTGSPGVGKTRLAVEAAARLADAFVDGVFFVDLAPLDGAELVLPTVARALGRGDAPRQRLEESLAHDLRARSLLLVFDNFEHVLGASAQIVHLLGATRRLKVLATSRAALRLRWEQRLVVPPLAVPDLDSRPTLADLAGAPAVRLFVERARAVDPAFGLGEANAPAVAAICRHLEGLPLAIELAAARAALLPPPTLLAQLAQEPLDLLAGGPADLPDRQRTLRSAIAWSYRLLPPGGRALFGRLATFAGGCTLEAAAAVYEPPDDRRPGHDPAGPLLDALQSLVEAHLVQRAEQPDGTPRFGMLETIREYARERLEESRAADAVRSAHARYFVALAERAEVALRGALDQGTWLDRLERERDNLRAAMRWAHDEGGAAAPLSARLASALARWWAIRGDLREGGAWLAAALARPGGVPSGVRAKALWAAGFVAFTGGDLADARRWLEESAALARADGDRPRLAEALRHLGIVRSNQGDPAAARHPLEESLRLFEAIGDAWGAAWSLKYLADASLREGDLSGAEAQLEQALARFRAQGDGRGAGWALHGLGRVASARRDAPAAERRHAEALTLFRRLDERQGVGQVLADLGDALLARGELSGAAALFRESLDTSGRQGNRQRSLRCLVGVASLALRAGEPVRTVRLLGAVEAEYAALGAVQAPERRRAADGAAAVARDALGGDAFATALAEGRSLDWEQVLGEVRAVLSMVEGEPPPAAPAPAGPRRRRRTTLPDGLTLREREVLRLVAAGRSNREIGAELVLSVRTVEKHVASVYAKIGARGRADAATYALRHDLLPDGASAG
jgi:predicted ATPase/DNA-binding CsgD family transcriptional regulator